MKTILTLILILSSCDICFSQPEPIRISSKNFPESYILAEIFSKTITDGFPEQEVKLNLGMGGTGILFEALKSGDIDIYPEYTGTIAEAMLKRPELTTFHDITKALLPLGLVISRPLGFNNTYAFAVKKKTAQKYGLNTISDLAKFPDLRFAFSYEFLKRSDGYYALAKEYGLKHEAVRGMQHSLAYQAIETESVDLIDVYTTDAKIKKLDLKILEDDLDFFPRYDAVILARVDFARNNPAVWQKLKGLEAGIDSSKMVNMNALVDLEKRSFKEAASTFFETGGAFSKTGGIKYGQIWTKTKEHLFLVFVSLSFSIIIGVTLGCFAASFPWLRQSIFAVSGVIQTIPSLALLCFLIPFLGIGKAPALTALFLYGLLPIVRNTCSGIESIDNKLKETGYALGLTKFQILFWIEMPISMPGILAGIKTSAVINVGTATLAAFIGCGGLGSFIVTGLALNDISVVLHGAVPSAILALILQSLFEWVDKLLIPKGLRLANK